MVSRYHNHGEGSADAIYASERLVVIAICGAFYEVSTKSYELHLWMLPYRLPETFVHYSVDRILYISHKHKGERLCFWVRSLEMIPWRVVTICFYRIRIF